jgi:isopropylmalate/homocitrate/citramalate synthase
MNKPWLSDKWFTSPWNFADDVRERINFADNIKIHDITLRDGEQQAGIIFNKEDKIEIAEKLAEAGVHRIEAGMPAVSKQDEEAIRELVKRDLGDTEVFAFSRCMKEDVKRAVDCGVSGIVVEIPSSEHIIKYAYQWPLEKAIDLSIEATQYAKENGLYTVFFPIDASRAEMEWFLDLIQRVATEGHMDALALVDTFGGLNPHSVPYLVRKVRERVKTPLEAHFHDDFGMAAANTVIALASGVEVAHTTITGIGERAGNAPYEDIVTALKTMYNKDIGIDLSRLYAISKMMQKKAKLTVRSNRPIIGDTVFEIESGIISDWVEKCGEEYRNLLSPFLPELVGNKKSEIVFGKNNGIPNVTYGLRKLGLEATDDEKTEILQKIKAKSFEKKELISFDEFKEIVKEVLVN